ncbi:MAG TPA: hypothetical protein VNN80_24240, partial [Polyangiaceae bacterium]|nr:hypothetical protein [Polyangiaceae bacterium]
MPTSARAAVAGAIRLCALAPAPAEEFAVSALSPRATGQGVRQALQLGNALEKASTEIVKPPSLENVTVVGAEVSVNDAVQRLGSRSPQQLEARRDRVDMRRILVSREAHVSRSLGELDLARQFNAPITRGRRAMAEVGRFVGDSERELAEIDYVALALGVSLGLSLALVPLPIAGTSLRLGAAGGPLLVALFLGRLGRTGRLVWSLPCEAKTTCACSPAARSGEATLRCAQPAPSR